MGMWRRSGLAVATAVAISVTPRPPAEAQPPAAPVFGAAVELVRLDVIVLDKEGRPVKGLGKDDFLVEEDGKPQVIESFEPVVVHARRRPSDEPSRLSASHLRAPSEGRCLLVFVDDLHVTQTSALRLATALRRLLEEDVRDGDWVTLVAPEQQLWWTARTAWEHQQLAAVVGRLKGQGAGNSYADWESLRAIQSQLPGVGGRGAVMAGADAGAASPGGVGAPAGSGGTPSDEAVAGVGKADRMFLGEETEALVKRNTGITLAALRQALEALVALRGHKSLVLVSEGFLLLPEMPGYREAIDFARRANVAIHFLDPRGLEVGGGDASEPGAAPGVMPGTALALPSLDSESLAVATGGSVFTSTDGERSLRRLMDESEAYYLVGYSPASPGAGERRVKVTVKRDGLTVRARNRYYVPEPARPDPKAPSPIFVAMRSLADSTDLPIRVATLFYEPSKKSEVVTMLAVEVVPPPGKTGERLFKLVSEARARDGGPAVRDQFEGSPKVAPGVPIVLSRQWSLPSGVWQVRLVVEDTATGRIGTAFHTFEVPDAKAFRMSTPILTSEIEDPRGKRRPKVALSRTFRSGSVLYCQYSVYNAPPAGKHDWAPHEFGSWTLRRGSELVREAPPTLIQPAPDGRVTRTLGLSLQGLPPGEYSLELRVRDEATGREVARQEAFTVAP
jgi:VWFA-related protein